MIMVWLLMMYGSRLLHLLHDAVETAGQQDGNGEENERGLHDHGVTPAGIWKFLHFLKAEITADEGEAQETERDESELGLHIHDEPPKCCCSLNVALPLEWERIQTDKLD